MQTFMHAPQFNGSLLSSTQTPPQLVCPVGQHALLVGDSPAGQAHAETTPLVAQILPVIVQSVPRLTVVAPHVVMLVESTQAAPFKTRGAAQVAAHALAEHTRPAPHATPAVQSAWMPQFCVFTVGSTHTPPQKNWPEGQHRPFVTNSPA
jgi:hypothetical protein